MPPFECVIIAETELGTQEIWLLHEVLKLDHSGVDVADIMELSFQGQLQLWRFRADGAHAILVTEIKELKAGKELRVRYVVGEKALKYLDQIEERLSLFARSMECRWISADCRPGMARVLEKRGYGARTVNVLKEL